MAWTLQQKQAIESRGKNLLVAAAAGSGKTAVLVERITQMILENFCSVDEMLIMTFTNSAAQEMRTRIHKEIAKKMEAESDGEVLAKLERQSILLGGASIMTFHAFCLSVIKKYFSKIDFDPKFREASEHELDILKQEVIEKLFEEKYSRYDDALKNFSEQFEELPENFDELFAEKFPEENSFVKFAEEFGGNVHGDSALHKIILDLHKFSQSRPYPKDWLKSLAECYENPEKNSWLENLLNFAKDEVKKNLDAFHSESLSARDMAAAHSTDKNLDTPKLREKWAEVVRIFESDLKIAEDLKFFADDWDGLFAKLSGKISFETYPRTKFPEPLTDVKDFLRDRRGEYKKILEKIFELVTAPKSEIVAEIKSAAESVRRLSEITVDFDEAFAAAKRELGIIDFDDMEHLALEIFNADESTSEIFRKKFRVVMVDEYQDTNDVQEEILSKIVRADNFFAVGDVKQSIYRFRNAAPENFLNKYKTYPTLENSERIDLSKNFRSRTQVLDAVNIIFRRLMTEDAMEIEYNKDAELNFGAGEIGSYLDGENIFDESAECIFIAQEKNSSSQKISDDDSEELSDKLELEAQLVADKIKFFMDSGKKIWDREQKIYRPIQYRDIVILLRSAEGKAMKILDVLHDNSIPAYAEDKGGYFRAREIQTMLSLLNILDNSRQDIPLAAVMLSPIGGFSAEDLARLRIGDRDSDLFTLLENCSAGNGLLPTKCKNFLDQINDWRKLSRQVGVPELLSTIYRESGYYNFFNNAAGRIAQANLRVLIDRAADYEKTAFRGLSRFIGFIKKIRELGNDLAAARTMGENEDVVRVMTIHKSKGLEFPIVFVLELGKRFNMQELRGNVIAHRNLGIGICRAIAGEFGMNLVPTFAWRVIKKKVRLENLAEELRILYVAFTRAKEKLILVGTGSESFFESAKNFDETKKIPSHELQKVTTPLDWLMMAKNAAEKFIYFEIINDKNIVRTSGEKISVDEPPEKIPETIEQAATSPLANIPAKLSVTELKRRINEADDETFSATKNLFDRREIYRRPNFIQASEISGAEFGTLMHSVMQHLDLHGNLTRDGISAQIDEMVQRQIFTEEHGNLLKKKSWNIAKFFASPLGKKILTAKKIYRELPFNRYIDAGTIRAGENFSRAAGEKIFVQGIIDLLFQDSTTGDWILLDYKTDRDNSDEYFRKEYAEQIKFYVGAAESLLGLKVSEKYLYLLGAGRQIDLQGEVYA